MSFIHVSMNAYQGLIDALSEEGHMIAFVRPCKAVSEAISMHPDIFIVRMGTSLKSPVFGLKRGRLPRTCAAVGGRKEGNTLCI